MVGVAEDLELVQVLARRDVAQREGRADHVAALGRHRPHVLDRLVPQAALVERGAERRDADAHQLRRAWPPHRVVIVSCAPIRSSSSCPRPEGLASGACPTYAGRPSAAHARPRTETSHANRHPALRPVRRRHRRDQRHRVGGDRRRPRPADQGAGRPQRHPRRAARGSDRHLRRIRGLDPRPRPHPGRRLRQLPGEAQVADRRPRALRAPARGAAGARRALVPLQRRQRLAPTPRSRSRASPPSSAIR